MKKRGLLTAVILATVFLTGCNVNVNFTPDEPASGTVSEVDSEEVRGAENGSEVTQNSENGNGVSVATTHSIQIDFEWVYESNDNPFLWAVDYEYPVLDSEEYPELSQAVQDYRMAYVRNIEAARDELATMAEQDYSEWGEEQWMGYYTISESMTVKRADATAVSIVEQGYFYQGGAHGSDGFGCFNVDTQTGNRIALDDVITDMNALSGVIATEMLELYPDITYFTPTLEETIEMYINPEITLTWTLEYNGVTFYFGSYEIGTYADGRQQVTVLFSEYPTLFNTYYFNNVTDDYVIPASAWGTLDVDLDADRDTDHITVIENYTNPEEGFSSFTIRVNGHEYTQDAYGWVLNPYYVRANGKSYLYVVAKTESDYAESFVYEITGNSIAYQGMFNGAVKYFTNSSDFCVMERMNMLSTMTGVARCYVGADGMPVNESGIYDVYKSEEIILTSLKEITAEEVDVYGDLTGAFYTFPAGIQFTYLRTDGKIYVDMLASDGRQCRFYTSNTEWPPTVNGMDATECFETIYSF